MTTAIEILGWTLLAVNYWQLQTSKDTRVMIRSGFLLLFVVFALLVVAR